MIKETEILEYLRIKQMLDYGLLDRCFKYCILLKRKLKNNLFFVGSPCQILSKVLGVAHLQQQDIEITRTAIKCQMVDRTDCDSIIPMETHLDVLYIPLDILWTDLEIVVDREVAKLFVKDKEFEKEQINKKLIQEDKEFEHLWSKLEVVLV